MLMVPHFLYKIIITMVHRPLHLRIFSMFVPTYPICVVLAKDNLGNMSASLLCKLSGYNNTCLHVVGKDNVLRIFISTPVLTLWEERIPSRTSISYTMQGPLGLISGNGFTGAFRVLNCLKVCLSMNYPFLKICRFLTNADAFFFISLICTRS